MNFCGECRHMGICSVYIACNNGRCAIKAEQGKHMEHPNDDPGTERNKNHHKWNNQQKQKK